MLVKKRLYFDNGNCYLDFSWHTIDQEIDIFRPSTSLKEFFSMSYKYEELQDDEILSQLQEIDKTIKQLKVLNPTFTKKRKFLLILCRKKRKLLKNNQHIYRFREK